MASKQSAVMMVLLLLFLSLRYTARRKTRRWWTPLGTALLKRSSLTPPMTSMSQRTWNSTPARNELWIANRATDSITIVHNTGLENQTSENREDAYSNHFLEEVSAIAFGAYHPEFDWQWGSAQETANTYCGQAAANNFMGPTLWPSSLDHYAVENQNNNLLGSHIDMNHESPYGDGIAHD